MAEFIANRIAAVEQEMSSMRTRYGNLEAVLAELKSMQEKVE